MACGSVYSVYHTYAVTVEVYCNGNLVGSGIANNFRKDLMEMSMHVTGKCEFNILLGGVDLTGGELTVFAKDDVEVLKNGSVSL
jgi:hypothetical protein